MLGKTLKTGALGVVGAAGGVLGAALFKGFNRLSAIDQAKAKLTGLGNSTKTVDQIMKNALASVQGTAFGLDEAATTAGSVVAAGIKPGQQLQGVLKTVADTAAIAGTSMSDMGLIFGSVAARGKLQGDDLLQLQARGIPVLATLAKHLHTTSAEVSDMVSKGSIDFKTFADSMHEKLGGAALSSGKTVKGSLANVNAALGRLGAAALSGAFSKLPGALNGVTKKLDDLGPTAERIGKNVGEGLTKASDAAEKFIKQMQDGTGAGGKFADTVGTIASVTKDLVTTSGKVLGFFNGLPGPLKTIAIEGALAALVFPRLAAGVTMATKAVGSQITSLRVLRLEYAETIKTGKLSERQTRQLGSAFKAAAGVGGMVALTEGAKQSNKALGTLELAAGGAALGFSVGGPWGAAIGGGVGLLAGLTKAFRGTSAAAKASDTTLRRLSAAKVAKDNYDTLRGSLDKATGAYTRNTRAAVENWLQTDEAGKKVSAQLGAKGIGNRTIIESILGNPRANARVAAGFKASMASINEQITSLEDANRTMKATGQQLASKAGADKFLGNQALIEKLQKQRTALSENQGAFTGYRTSLRQTAKDTRNFVADTAPIHRLLGITKRAYESTFSKKVRGELKLDGVPKTIAGLKSVLTQVHLTPKQIKVIASAPGSKLTLQQIKGLANAGKASATSLNSSGKDIGKAASRTGAGFVDKLSRSIGGGKPKVSGSVRRLVNGSITPAQALAKANSPVIGSQIDAGIIGGLAAGSGPVAAQARSVIRQAFAAMRAEADSHSPSRKTIKLGKDIGAGLPIGMRASGRVVNAAATKVMRGLFSKFHGIGKGTVNAFATGVRGTEGQASKATDKMMEAIAKSIKSKKNKDGISKAAAQSMRRVVNAISTQAATVRNLRSNRADLAQSVSSSLQGEFSLSDFASSEPNSFGFKAPVTAKSIVAGASALKDRLKSFLTKLKALRGAGMPAALLGEIANLGSVQGLEVATAFLADKGQIRQLASTYNQITAAKNSYTKSIGNVVGDATYGAAIKQQTRQLDAMLARRAKAQARDTATALSGALRANPLVLKTADNRTLGRFYVEGQKAAANLK